MGEHYEEDKSSASEKESSNKKESSTNHKPTMMEQKWLKR